jgi:2-polyprenyl-3-methyl-5-hydroxy-6-metoxy-1,4-benzoquinol methylase
MATATAVQRQTPATSVKDALEIVRSRFPFPGYVDSLAEGSSSIASLIMKYLPPSPNAKVMDFGCGPGDKPALLAALGYQVSGYDELKDDWHTIPENRAAILKFHSEMGMDFREAKEGEPLPWSANTFDVVMINDVIEHLHDSPRTLFNALVTMIKEDGYFLVSVPNAANIRKRIDLARGRTNYQQFNFYYWHPDPWRGHVREYTKGDLQELTENLGLKLIELKAGDHMLRRIPKALHPPYLAVTSIFPGWKDTWLLLAQKPRGWKPKEVSREELSKIFVAFGAGHYPGH